MYPFHEQKDIKKEDDRCRISSLFVGAFISLIGLAIVVITQNYWGDTTIKILLFSMFIVLISGFYGHRIVQNFKNYLKNRKYNKLAKSHFKIFKELTIRFKKFTEDRYDNIQYIMKSIKNETDLSQINVVQQSFLQQRWKYYEKRVNLSNETKDDLVSLTEEFESILDMYDTLYLKDPLKNIVDLGREKVPSHYKVLYNNVRLKYIAFLMDYKKFAEIANEDLVEKKDLFRFQEYFENPEEL